MTATTRLKAPFPWFGGKARVAPLIWGRLGDVDNFIEPFCGSAAVLWNRPHQPKIETINDADCMVANFWRATQRDPEAVAEWADSPVNEADLHARHRWLVLSPEAAEFRQRMRTDPDYYDAKIAGWWCWGLCCWIGGGWCAGNEHGEMPHEWEARIVAADRNAPSRGVNGVATKLSPGRKPRIDGGESQHGHGIHAKGARPDLASQRKQGGMYVHRQLSEVDDLAFGRPQLADAYDIGRGVNSNGTLGTCDQRRAWLVDWFGRLRDRMRLVRVCCGDWLRVCDSESVTTRLGITGICFDPPYGAAADRDMNLYAVDCGKVAAKVRAYCLERGDDRRYRICLAGYEGEGHEALEAAGWHVTQWQAQGGYGNRSAKGKANAKKERLWFSPGCIQEPLLWD